MVGSGIDGSGMDSVGPTTSRGLGGWPNVALSCCGVVEWRYAAEPGVSKIVFMLVMLVTPFLSLTHTTTSNAYRTLWIAQELWILAGLLDRQPGRHIGDAKKFVFHARDVIGVWCV